MPSVLKNLHSNTFHFQVGLKSRYILWTFRNQVTFDKTNPIYRQRSRCIDINIHINVDAASYMIYKLKTKRHTGWTVRGSNPGRGEIFRTSPDRPWGPPRLLYNGYWVSFSGVKRPGRGVDHPPHIALRLKKEYSYTPTPPLSLRGLL